MSWVYVASPHFFLIGARRVMILLSTAIPGTHCRISQPGSPGQGEDNMPASKRIQLIGD